MADWIQTHLSPLLASGSVWAYALVFLGGVLASFTPCTYPVLPLTVGYVGNAAEGSRGRALLLSLALVTGMALVYAAVGIGFAILGKPLGTLAGSGWILFGVALFFIGMSLFLLDVFAFPLPRFLQRALGGTGSRRQGLIGAFVTGVASGFLVGPCTGPILGIVLVGVTATLRQADGMAYAWSILDGGFKLFLFGLGQGALILLCGVFASLLAHLPRSGAWLMAVKKAFALLILLGASLLLVYVGQNTDFPRLSEWFAPTSSSPPPLPVDRFGGEEFLK